MLIRLLRLMLYAAVGYFIYRVIQFAGRMISSSRRSGEDADERPPEVHVPDYRDIKDADFIDLTPKDREGDAPKGS